MLSLGQVCQVSQPKHWMIRCKMFSSSALLSLALLQIIVIPEDRKLHEKGGKVHPQRIEQLISHYM